jgi:hypothetical protein
LALLRDADPVQALTAQAQRALSAGLPFEQAQELALLASDLQAGVSSLPSRTPPALAPVTPLSTPLPGSTPSSTPSETNLSTTPGTAAPTATRLPPTLTPLPSDPNAFTQRAVRDPEPGRALRSGSATWSAADHVLDRQSDSGH